MQTEAGGYRVDPRVGASHLHLQALYESKPGFIRPARRLTNRPAGTCSSTNFAASDYAYRVKAIDSSTPNFMKNGRRTDATLLFQGWTWGRAHLETVQKEARHSGRGRI